MPTFELTGPDGGTYQVDAPDAQAAVSALSPAAAPSESSSVAGAAKSLGVGLAKGAIGLAGLPGDIGRLGLNLAHGGTYRTDAPDYGSENIQKNIESATGKFYEPKGTLEETAQKVGEFAPAILGGPETLGAKILTRAVAPAIASEAAGKLTEGTAAQPYAELAGALAGGAGGTMAANKFKQMAAARQAASLQPTAGQLYKSADGGFNAARDMNVVVKPDFAANAAADMRDSIKNYDPALVSGVHGAADRLENLGTSASSASPNQSVATNMWGISKEMLDSPMLQAGRASISGSPQAAGVALNDVENIRKQLVSLKTSPDASIRSAAKDAITSLQKSQMGITAADTLAGDAGAYTKTIKDAVGDWAAMKRSNTVTGKIDLATLNAGTAGSGANIDNNMRQAFKQLARPINNTNTPVWKKLGFNAEEGAAIEQAATGTMLGNTARYLGKAAPTGIVSGAMSSGAGHMAGGPIGAVALPAAGYIAKKIGDLSTKRAVAAVDSLVRSRSPLATQVVQQLPPQLINMLPSKTARTLTALIAADRIAARTNAPVNSSSK